MLCSTVLTRPRRRPGLRMVTAHPSVPRWLLMGEARWPRIAFRADPATGARPGMAHACYPREQTAVCGISAPYLAQAWPRTDVDWVFPYARCPACAQGLYHRART